LGSSSVTTPPVVVHAAHGAPHYAIRHVPKANGANVRFTFGCEDDEEEGENEGRGHTPRDTGSGHHCAHVFVCEPVTSRDGRGAEKTCIGIDQAEGETLAWLVGLFLATSAYETDAKEGRRNV
jgi:hypothetical protein